MPTIDHRLPLVFLMGATATGKTQRACDLAVEFPLDLVSVDSTLVYRGMDIGTAKPDARVLARHPHRLIDIREPEQAYSAADFRADALREIADIHARGRIPLLVGGTGLYFRALERGLSELPRAEPAVRERLAEEVRMHGKLHMHRRLAGCDAKTAARLDANDVQRVLRALEVFELSGVPISEQQGGVRGRLPWRVLKLGLVAADRSNLRLRIAERFDQMLAQGLENELRSLRARPGWSADLPSMRAVGYRQGWDWLDGKVSATDFRMHALHATSQLAKRQMTWLRSEHDAWLFDCDAAASPSRIHAALAAFL